MKIVFTSILCLAALIPASCRNDTAESSQSTTAEQGANQEEAGDQEGASQSSAAERGTHQQDAGDHERILSPRTEDTKLLEVEFQKIFISRTGLGQSIGPRHAETRTEEQSRRFASELKSRLDAGESFDDYARRYSEDAFAKQGGRWPRTPIGDFSVWFAKEISKLPVGKVSDVIEQPDGFTILRVNERIEGPVEPTKTPIPPTK